MAIEVNVFSLFLVTIFLHHTEKWGILAIWEDFSPVLVFYIVQFFICESSTYREMGIEVNFLHFSCVIFLHLIGKWRFLATWEVYPPVLVFHTCFPRVQFFACELGFQREMAIEVRFFMNLCRSVRFVRDVKMK